MARMFVRVRGPVKRELRRLRQKTSDKGLAMRCQIILLWGEGEGWFEIAKGVGCSMSWVGRVSGSGRTCMRLSLATTDARPLRR